MNCPKFKEITTYATLKIQRVFAFCISKKEILVTLEIGNSEEREFFCEPDGLFFQLLGNIVTSHHKSLRLRCLKVNSSSLQPGSLGEG
jgi:hypothetical protein